jgi:hypothetical protein
MSRFLTERRKGGSASKMTAFRARGDEVSRDAPSMSLEGPDIQERNQSHGFEVLHRLMYGGFLVEKDKP